MLSVRAGIDTFRYWGAVDRGVAERTPRVDREAILGELRGRWPAANDMVAALENDGVVAVPGYWPAKKCVTARAEIDRLLAEYPDAVQKFSAGSDKRMFGVEAKSAVLAEFHGDRFLRSIGEQLKGFSLYNFATLGARIDAISENNGSGDGWHRDAHGYQYKSILYLSDVDDDNGPFEYLVGSHRRWRAAVETAFGGLPPAPNTRYAAELIDRVVKRFGLETRSFIGEAGTLLLVNTSGIHRGRPLRSGSRYALTNYFYHPFQIDENRIKNFPMMLPGAADRVRADLLAR
jgi:hypothetical protein